MTNWMIWLLVSAFWFIAEMITVGFLLFWLGIGALLAMAVSFVTDSVLIQVLVFAISSTILIILTKPIVNKYFKAKDTPSNVYTILGKKAIVTEEINNVMGKGQIKVDSDIWSARSDNDQIIPKGAQVEILRIDGVKVIVKSNLLIESKN